MHIYCEQKVFTEKDIDFLKMLLNKWTNTLIDLRLITSEYLTFLIAPICVY